MPVTPLHLPEIYRDKVDSRKKRLSKTGGLFDWSARTLACKRANVR